MPFRRPAHCYDISIDGQAYISGPVRSFDKKRCHILRLSPPGAAGAGLRRRCHRTAAARLGATARAFQLTPRRRQSGSRTSAIYTAYQFSRHYFLTGRVDADAATSTCRQLTYDGRASPPARAASR